MDSGKGRRGAAGRVTETPDSSSAAPLLLIVSVWRLIYSSWIYVHGDLQSYWLTRLGNKASRKNPFRELFSVRFRDCGWICVNNIHRLCQFINSENLLLICFLCIICKLFLISYYLILTDILISNWKWWICNGNGIVILSSLGCSVEIRSYYRQRRQTGLWPKRAQVSYPPSVMCIIYLLVHIDDAYSMHDFLCLITLVSHGIAQ